MTSTKRNPIDKIYDALSKFSVGAAIAIVSVLLTSANQNKVSREFDVDSKVSIETFNAEIQKLHKEKASKETVDILFEQISSQSAKIDEIQRQQSETYKLLVQMANNSR